MNCRDFRIDILNDLENRLDTRQRLALEKHLGDCKTCHAFSLKMQDFSRFIDREKVAAFDPYMFTRIQASMDARDSSQRFPAFRRILQPLLIVTLLLIMVYTGIVVGRGYAYQNSLNNDLETELFYISDIHTADYKSF